MARNPDRPLSPHLTIWKWGPAMTVSILHRITGDGLAVAGLAALTWWLWALASGDDAFGTFSAAANHWAGIVVLVGLTWAFWQHTLSGIRHLVLDTGAGFERATNKTWSLMTFLGAVVLTAVTWLIAVGVPA